MYKNNSKDCGKQCCVCNDGKDGAPGAQGAQGQQGPSGTRATFTKGIGIPPSGSGINGDIFIDTVTNNFYQKTNNVWILNGNLLGAQGVPGDQGINAFVTSTGVITAQSPPGSISVVHIIPGSYDVTFNTPSPLGYVTSIQLTQQPNGTITTVVTPIGTTNSLISISNNDPVTGGPVDLDFTLMAFPF